MISRSRGACRTTTSWRTAMHGWRSPMRRKISRRSRSSTRCVTRHSRWPIRLRTSAAPGPNAAAASAPIEEGLRWDLISQVGALLKNPSPGGPMAGFDVQRVYGTSHGGELATYIAIFHPARDARRQPAGLRWLHPASPSRPDPPAPVRRQAGADSSGADPAKRRSAGDSRRVAD